MVKKLFKHEFLFYARVMCIVYAILLTMAAANRIIQLFETDTVVYTIVSVFSGITYGFSVAACFGFSLVLTIIRFYRNLFTGEGYLTFTLPVTPRQHIAVKAITAVSMNIITMVMVLVSFVIITAGEMLKEIFIAARYLLDNLYELVGSHMITVGMEFMLLLLVASFSSVMLYYMFISIGQLFRKNRILTQIVSTLLTIVFSLLAASGALNQLGLWIAGHLAAAVHIGMWGLIALAAIITMVEFLVIKWIITKKLNLE